MNLTDLNQLSDVLWEIPTEFRSDMRVPARIYATKKMLRHILNEQAPEQLVNTSTLPGVQKYVLAMPDIHQGYGFPIGGVAAMRKTDGVISPGGVGYDINCGVRLLKSPYTYQELKEKIPTLISQIQRDVPSGVGRGSRLKLSGHELNAVLDQGVPWTIERGYGLEEDLDAIEERGAFRGASEAAVSGRAKQRGADQLGTLGAGNHFLEIQEVIEIYDEKTAGAFGLFKGQLTIMIHTGSRGLGHQVCTDYVALMNKKMGSFNIELPDRQLACAPFASEAGQDYLKAMAAAANFAFSNRQLITDHIRDSWQRVIGSAKNQLQLIYDVAHNVAKLEEYDGEELLIHRKGATRAFGPGHKELPEQYQESGQPVLIPGSMGTASYVLAGTKEALEKSFGSACHGAGRRMSRKKAKKMVDYQTLIAGLDDYGVTVRAGSKKGLTEEAPEAYKDIDEVVDVVHRAGLAKKTAKMKPVAIVKG